MALGGMAELVAASRETVRSELGVGDIGGTLDVPDTQIKVALVREIPLPNSLTGWWFQIFFIFTPIWGRFPF